MKAVSPSRDRLFHRQGMSVVEVLTAIVLFSIILAGLVKLHTEANLPRQGMIRDYTMAMNLCQRFLNSIAVDIANGEPPALPPGTTEQDVTEGVLEKAGSAGMLKTFAGGVGREASELTANFRVFLSVRHLGSASGNESTADRYYLVRIRCEWGQSKQHSFTLQSQVYRR